MPEKLRTVRGSVVAVLLSVVLSLLAVFVVEREEAQAQATPANANVLYVVTDDLDSELVEKYMPNTKALIRDAGAEFTNFYISESQCCPSRASALLGEYPHNTKVQQNDEPQGGEARFRAEGQESRTIANDMGSRGYATALFGKYLNGYDEARIPAGWDRWFAKHDQKFFDYDVTDQGRVEHFGTQPQAYSDEVVMRKARAHIRDVAEPWFVYLAPTGPHAPYDDPPGYGKVTGTPNRPPSYNERDVSDKPGYIRNQPSINGRAADTIRKNHVHRARKAAQIDDRIKDQIDALAARGELGNTYVIFTSDNGWMEGEHRRPSSKAVPYEESTRLPLFIRGPGIAPGTKVDALASNIDFFATFTDMQGDEQARDGRSLLPLATGEVSGSDWPRKQLLTEGIEGRSSDYNMVRYQQYKYVEYANGEKEMYDLSTDPFELESQHDTADPALLADLQRRLGALATCAAETCRTADSAP